MPRGGYRTVPMPEYGPLVWCPYTNDREQTRAQPGDTTGPWHCFVCGRTDHAPA